MNRHVHADKIIAKAENMDLVVLSRFKGFDWIESNVDAWNSFSFLSEYEYFICLEEHKEACLEFLNGGEVEVYHYDGWLTASHVKSRWTHESIFMHSETLIRIKPKKEKRWIAISLSRGVSNTLYETLYQAKNDMPFADQYVEIEVEV